MAISKKKSMWRNLKDNNENMVKKFKEDMMKSFEMTNFGLMHYFLGIEITQKEDGIFISQKKYIDTLLKKFKMEGSTRPDIMYASVSYQDSCTIQVKFTMEQLRELLDILNGTKNYGIWHGVTHDSKLVGYTDSDWVGKLDDMKSTTGYAFTIGSRIFSWVSKKQATFVQSSTEE
ncbi:secreted RxLR effector protein 161-like [Humulus lupulus]|uniref:secreted RxLR effector protein 161-like n=1 Tax=Humulus lupulus TaxID=3486 RepID=UPI002B40E247|nr:secreted RxLR effector protein 161-like [Humulus lupulus]